MKARLVLGVFREEDALVRAVHAVRAAEVPIHDAFTPYPIHGLEEAMGLARSKLPWVTFAGGATGVTIALLGQWWTHSVDWPIEIGGKPFAAWPAYAPVAFESMVLLAGLSTAAALFVASRLWPKPRPRLVHPRRHARHLRPRARGARRELRSAARRAHPARRGRGRDQAGRRGMRRWLALAPLLVACNAGPDDPGVMYMPEMVVSTPYDAHDRNPILPNGMTLQAPPEGTVPQGFEPFHYALEEAELAAELANPIAPDEAAIARGRAQFETFCLVCHGARGDGDGPVVPPFPEPAVAPRRAPDDDARRAALPRDHARQGPDAAVRDAGPRGRSLAHRPLRPDAAGRRAGLGAACDARRGGGARRDGARCVGRSAGRGRARPRPGPARRRARAGRRDRARRRDRTRRRHRTCRRARAR
ncbi:MAG: DUF3341 domain-containing protein [Sandaracinaceae bacterium]|nr:DUF3341 domain-containing protein [Sandaracinaceae bacterium]